jgi:predicted aspartyl protease
MPEVFVKALVSCGDRKASVELLLNSGARNAELVLRKSLAERLELKTAEEVEVHFGCVKIRGSAGALEVRVENPETGELRTAVLEAIVLPNDVLDCSLIGVIGQEKLRIIPDTSTGKAIFK